MEDRDRSRLLRALPDLVAATGKNELDRLLGLLQHDGLLSPAMANRYRGPLCNLSERVRDFYMDIQKRGPEAYKKLTNALYEIGQWDLVKILNPDDPLNHSSRQYHSLREETEPPALRSSTETNVSNDVLNLENLIKRTETIELNEETECLRPINVKTSSNFNDSLHPEISCYSMKSKSRGILLFINNIEFSDDIEEIRHGAKEDEKNLRELFTQVGFHEFILYENFTKKQIEDGLRRLTADPKLRKTDCIFVLVASHGRVQSKETYVVCSDGNLMSSTDIIDYFNSENCVYLHNIPKVFIFQLCRGVAPDYGFKFEGNVAVVQNDEKTDRTQMDGKGINATMRTYSDMLIVHSTVPGFQSHRDIKLGSWFFISMCQVFKDHCHNTHLEDLFKLVDAYLRDIKLKRGTLQTPSVDNWGFNRHCYLNPGKFE